MRQIAGAGLLVLARVVPLRAVVGGVVWCPFHRLTGRPCPTCGLTRSVVAAAHGQVRQSVGFHAFGPLVVIGVIAVSLGLGDAAGGGGAGWPNQGRPRRRTLEGIVAVVWTAYAVHRALRRGSNPVGRRGTGQG